MEVELFMKYKSSYIAAFKDVFIHTLFMTSGIYSLWYFRYSAVSLITIPFMSFMTIRTFLIFHDCCHNSYTPNRLLNCILSHITGVFVITSPNWILSHHTHHLTNGNIENEHHFLFNETIPYTKKKFLSKTKKEQNNYIMSKNPFVFFGIIPLFYFIFVQRYMYAFRKYKRPYAYQLSLLEISMVHIINNVLSFLYFYKMYQYQILPHCLLFFLFACSLAFILFHNQHTFNPAYVVGKEWTQRNSGLEGSSFIQIPLILKYFFMGIEYHHIHHMNSKLPGYNLQKYHESYDFYNIDIVKLSLNECYNNLWLVLYDEDKKKYITFDELNEELELCNQMNEELRMIKID